MSTASDRSSVHLRLSLFAACALPLWLGACSSTPARHAAPLVAAPPVAGSARVDAANAVLFRAMSLVGTPYRWGGNTPDSGFDCSGLVGYVFRDAAGLALPRQSSAIAALGGAPIALRSLLSGDLVFFASGREIDHVGIYVGEGRFVHAPNRGGTVRLDDLDGWWREHFRYGKRVW